MNPTEKPPQERRGGFLYRWAPVEDMVVTSKGAAAIRDRRPERRLIELDGVLLNAPQIAAGYNGLLRAVRTENSLPADIRELLILRVAALNSAAYEWIEHEQLGRDAGLTDAQLIAVRDVALIKDGDRGHTVLDESQRAALDYCDYMTRHIHIPQAVFDALRPHFSDQQVTEITLTVATYNMVSRFLVALDVGDMANVQVPRVELEQESIPH